jgi:anhydro-N-acetylmuramic acid kinase
MSDRLQKLRVIGLMSGTSFDGIDVSLAETDGVDFFKAIHHSYFPYPDALRAKLKSVTQATPILEILKLEKEISYLYVEAILSLKASNETAFKEKVDVISLHGQTVYHNPKEAITLQLGNPHILAEELGVNVISDLRRRDMAAGGEGAPLIPMFHKLLIKRSGISSPTAILNIGGVSNITFIAGDEVIAFDVGMGNAPLDDLMHRKLNLAYDKDGEVAASGKVNMQAAEQILSAPFFKASYPKSLDRNQFDYQNIENLELKDALATICYVIAEAVEIAARSLPIMPTHLYVTGGGRRNKTIMSMLKGKSYQVYDIDLLGIDGDMVESYGFAYLGARAYKGLSLSTPAITKVKCLRSGGVFCRA